jgi:TRAP transporter TatT component family protein
MAAARVLVAVLVATVAGCGAARKAAVSGAGPVLKASIHAYEKETDVEVARAAAPAMLEQVEGLLETSPDNPELLEIVARGWAEYAFGFLEDDLESLANDEAHAEERHRLVLRATGLYDRAFQLAVRRIAVDDPGIRAALAGNVATLERHLAGVPKAAVSGLMFAGLALASAANLNRTDPSRAVDLPRAIALLERARQLDPSYYFGGAQMVLGIIYCSAPKAAGGDPERGQRYFEEAVAQTGGRYLLPRVMAARQCDVRLGARAHFERTLHEALAAAPTREPRFHLANEIAKRRAARYVGEARRFF